MFAGSFELDAVETVCTGDIAGDEIVDLVWGLVDKSIVVRHERGTVAHYRLLEAIREFGLERLKEAGDGPALRMRHLQWCMALIHTAKAEWISERQLYWLARLAAENANIRSAIDFCLAEAQVFCPECERDYRERRGRWAPAAEGWAAPRGATD